MTKMLPKNPHQVTLQEVFSFWKGIHKSMLNILELLEDKDLNYQMHDKVLSIGDTLKHMVFTYHWWLGSVVKDGKSPPTRDESEPVTVEILKKLFHEAQERLSDFINSLTVEDWTKVYSGTHQGEPHERSLLWVLWHLIEHDIHHRAQIKLYMTNLGKKVPYKDFWY